MLYRTNALTEGVLSVMDGFDFEAFGDFWLEKGLHEDVVATIISNRICSETFLDLTEIDLKELAPTIGDRIRLRNILEETRKVRQYCLMSLLM